MPHLNVFGGRNPAFAALWAGLGARQPMHPADITAALKKLGSSQTAIANDLGVSQASVWSVIAGRKKSARIARCIARQTGISVEEMWPGKYLARGKK